MGCLIFLLLMSNEALSFTKVVSRVIDPQRNTEDIIGHISFMFLCLSTFFLIVQWIQQMTRQIILVSCVVRNLLNEGESTRNHMFAIPNLLLLMSTWTSTTLISMDFDMTSLVEMNALFCYLGWIVTLIYSLLQIKKSFQVINDSNMEQVPQYSFKKKRWKSKKRTRYKKREVFHHRAKRRRHQKMLRRNFARLQKQDKLTKFLVKTQNKWDQFPDFFDLDIGLWQTNESVEIHEKTYLHLLNFADEFDSVCQLCPDMNYLKRTSILTVDESQVTTST